MTDSKMINFICNKNNKFMYYQDHKYIKRCIILKKPMNYVILKKIINVHHDFITHKDVCYVLGVIT